MPGWQLMALRERFDRLHRGRELALNLCRSLRRRVREMEGMEREREALQMAAIDVVCLFPSRDLGLSHLYQRSGLVGRLLRSTHLLASCQGLPGFRQCLLRVSPTLAKRQ